MRELITVSSGDIRQGKRWRAQSCPVALALQRQLGDVFMVSGSVIRVLGSGLKINSPRSVRRFVKRFDKGCPCKPFRFYLKHP